MFYLRLLATLDWILMLVLICTELAGRILRRVTPNNAPVFPPPSSECSFIVGAWHARDALKQSLPALWEAVQNHGSNHEIIVILDYQSNDGNEQYVRQKFPDVKLVVSRIPLYYNGFSRWALELATYDTVVLLNNDVVVEKNFVAPLLQAFEDPRVFGVASQVCDS